MSLGELPPIVLAIIALGSGLTWQAAGTLAIVRLTPASMSSQSRLALAWFCWLPLSGGVVLALVLAGVASRAVLLIGVAVVALLAVLSVRFARPVLAEARMALKSWLDSAQPYERWLWRIGLAMQAITWAFVAHPQRLYDQLNYHLLVGHLVVRDGQPFGAYDPHVSFAGIIDYSFAWQHAWTDSRLLFNANAQVAVLLCTLPILVWCGVRLGRPSLGLLGLLLLALPGLMPESAILRMSKPDGVLLTGVALLLALLVREPAGWGYAAAGLTGMLIASKLSFGHAIVGLALAFAIARPPWGRTREWWPLAAAGLVCTALQLTKNYLVFGNPFYPSAASLFPSWASDQFTTEYWLHVSDAGSARLTGWLGPFLLGRHAAGIFACVAGTLALVLVRRRQGAAPPPSSPEAPRSLAGVVAFVVGYWASWPLFYDGYVAPRFVSCFAGSLFVLFMVLHARVTDADRRWLQIACACIGIATAHLDRFLPGLVRWNSTSAFEAYAQQWPRIRTASALNPHLLTTDTVVADWPAKLHFDARLLFEAPLSPPERAILEELRQAPAQAAERYRVKAIVTDARQKMGPVLEDIWRGLEPFGAVFTVGPDRVLLSPCYFRSPCAELSGLALRPSPTAF